MKVRLLLTLRLSDQTRLYFLSALGVEHRLWESLSLRPMLAPVCGEMTSLFEVSSSALLEWQGQRAEHLNELLLAHGLVGGSGQGRRWRTEALNYALVLRLAAEFQGFARDLHDLSCGTFANWAAPANLAVQNVIRNRLIQDRQLEKGNAQPGGLGSDFGRFGFQLWPALAIRTDKSNTYNKSLERLNDARNGIAHADEAKLAKLRGEGFPIILATFRTWRGHLNGLAVSLDIEVSSQLANLFGRANPW
jgi:hypothetical protein